MKALIAGGGIGGLTAALFLHRAGIDVEVFERGDHVREIGVGINMLPHAVGALAKLGLLPELDAQGIRTRELFYANRFGQVVWQELRGVDAGHSFPQFSIHRGKLLALIHKAALERLGEDAIRTGSAVTDFKHARGGVEIEVAGPNGKSTAVAGDLLIGADGIHSTVRARLYPTEGPPVWSGFMLWRGCTRWPLWRDGRTMLVAGGNVAKFVFYPIGSDPDPGLQLTNWAVMAKTSSAGASPLRREDWSRPGVLSEVEAFVRGRFRLDFVDPLQIIEATDDFYEYPNCDREPLPQWTFGRVTLLGDAAHPMYPVGSNGASQAILDAKRLAICLKTAGTIEEALAEYEDQRKTSTSAIVLANRKGGPEGVIDTVEARAPDGFDDIEKIATYAERRAIVGGYAKMAGFAVRKDS